MAGKTIGTPIDNTRGAHTKAEKYIRKSIETAMIGDGLPIAPEWLTDEQRKYWDGIVNHYADSGMLAKIDQIMLTRTVVASEYCDRIDREVAQGIREMDKAEMSLYKDYFNLLKQGCAEFGLSIQARAKTGSLAWATSKEKQNKDPLLDIIGG